MVVTKRHKHVSRYTTWYDFRQQLANQLGYVPLNSLWLEIKPKSPLPWNDADMNTAVSAVAQREGQKTKRQPGLRQKRQDGCEEWPDCHTYPITIDECALWYDSNLF